MIVKRTFWFVLLLLSFVLVACGGGDSAEAAVSEPVSAVQTAIDVAALPDQISVEALMNWLSKPQLSDEIDYRLNFKGLESLLTRVIEILKQKNIQRKTMLQNNKVVNMQIYT